MLIWGRGDWVEEVGNASGGGTVVPSSAVTVNSSEEDSDVVDEDLKELQ